jgi:hypothetical protein
MATGSEIIRGTFTDSDTTYILSKAVKTLEKKFVLLDKCTPATLPDNSGTTARWVIPANQALGTVTNALDDTGGTPLTYATRSSKNQVSYTETGVTAPIRTYGAFTPQRRADMDNLRKQLADNISERLGYLGNLCLDTLIRTTVDGTGTSFAPSMGAGTTTTRKSIGDGTVNTTLVAADELTAEDIALGIGDLRMNDAEPFDNGMMAVIVHAGAEVDVITDVSATRLNWQEVNKHTSGITGALKIPKGLIGGIAGGMVERSNNIGTQTIDAIAAYANLVLSDGAVGMLHMNDMKPQVFINDAFSVDDPHRQYKTVAFQFRAAPKLIESTRAEILYSSAV